MGRPRLLDLYCGAILPSNRPCSIIGICLRLYVSSVVRNAIFKHFGRSNFIGFAVGYARTNGTANTKAQSRLSVRIVGESSKRTVRRAASVQWLAQVGLAGGRRRYAPVGNVASRFRCGVLPMLTGSIVRNLALKKLPKKEPWHFMKETLGIWIRSTKNVLPKIQGCGETKPAMKDLKLSVYWGANV